MTAPDPRYVFRVQGISTTTGPAGSTTGPWTATKTAPRTSVGSPTSPSAGVLTKFCDLEVTLIAVTPAGSPQTTTEKE